MIENSRMGNELRVQYQDRIRYLQGKIDVQQEEIAQLKELIRIMNYTKEYDC